MLCCGQGPETVSVPPATLGIGGVKHGGCLTMVFNSASCCVSFSNAFIFKVAMR